MITIYKTNTMADAANYITKRLGKVSKNNLDVTHTVIVPDRASLEAERALLSALGGSFNAQIKTFRRLAADILPKYEYLSKQAGIMALSGIIKDNRDRLTCYKKGVETAGFVENMYDTISMMKYCKVTPKMLEKSNIPESVRGKVKDIATLYQAYLDYTESRFIDSADKLDLLCESIAQTDVTANGFYYLYDFDNFSTQELAIVEQLMLKSMGVTIACCAGKNYQDKHLYLDDIYTSVLNICERNGIKPDIQQGYKDHKSKCAEQIANHMYRYGEFKPMEAGNFVEIYEGATRVDEVYALACRVKQYARDGGRYKDIYVVASDVAKYTNAIATVFDQFEIPYFCDRQFALADHPYARYIVDYLTLCKNNGKLNSVLPFVKNYLFCGEFDNSLAQNDDVFLFENFCLKYNVSYRYDSFSLGKDEPYYEQADEFRAKFNSLYTGIDVPDKATVSQYVAIVRKLIQASNLNERNEKFAEQQQAEKLTYEAKVTRQAQEKFEGVLLQAENVLGDRQVKLDEFIKTLTAGVASVKISVIPVYNDCVIFANMAKARKHDIKFLALLGANYGAMPIVKSDSKLLSDRNIKDLVSVGINVEPQIFTENKRERFSLFQLLMEPTKKLYVSYASVDGANSLIPSPFVNELQTLFTVKGQPLEPTGHTDENVYATKQALSKYVLNKRRLQDCQKVNVPSFLALRELFDEQASQYANNKDGKGITVEKGDKLYLKDSTTSVSQLTDFFHCPYGFYMRYGLNIKPRPVAELKPNNLGDILHAVLENYVKNMDPNESDETTKQKAKKHFADALNNDFLKGLRNDVHMKGVLSQIESESIRMCKVVKAQLGDSNFKNKATELSFGGKSNNRPVVVKFDGGEFRLQGKIDRVDVKDDHFIVIDYKSGATAATYTEKDLYVGHKMQLLVYVKAVEQLAKEQGKDLRPAGFYYFNMHDKFVDFNQKEYVYNGRTLDDVDVACDIDTNLKTKRKSEKLGLSLTKPDPKGKKQDRLNHQGKLSNKLLVDKEFDNQTEYAFALIRSAGNLMRKGYAAVNPYEGTCQYCDYKGICDYDDVYTYNARKVEGSIDKKTINRTVEK